VNFALSHVGPPIDLLPYRGYSDVALMIRQRAQPEHRQRPAVGSLVVADEIRVREVSGIGRQPRIEELRDADNDGHR
jgi:hypothetical protein